jgi:hypothetical protein
MEFVQWHFGWNFSGLFDTDKPVEPSNQDEMLMCEYAALAAIHDTQIDDLLAHERLYKDKEEISAFGDLTKFSDSYAGKDIMDYIQRTLGNIQRAVDDVKADLDSLKPEETDSQKAKFGFHSKRGVETPANGDKARAEIKKGNKIWTFNFNGETVPVDGKLKGLKLLEVLLTHPNKEYYPLELLQEAGLESQGSTASELVYESNDRRLINKDIENLQVDYDREQDPAKKVEIQEKIDHANEIMSKTTNKFGKSRSMSDKYRLKVSRLIKVVLEKIASDRPQLHNHFKAFLSFGTDNTYKPDKNIVWDIK